MRRDVASQKFNLHVATAGSHRLRGLPNSLLPYVHIHIARATTDLSVVALVCFLTYCLLGSVAEFECDVAGDGADVQCAGAGA